MEYESISKEQQSQVVATRLVELETKHYDLSLNIAVAKANKDDATPLESQLEKMENAIKVLRKEAKELPKPTVASMMRQRPPRPDRPLPPSRSQ